jgi:hypothetical protein
MAASFIGPNSLSAGLGRQHTSRPLKRRFLKKNQLPALPKTSVFLGYFRFEIGANSAIFMVCKITTASR